MKPVVIAFVDEFRQSPERKKLAGMAVPGKLQVRAYLFVKSKRRVGDPVGGEMVVQPVPAFGADVGGGVKKQYARYVIG